MYSTYSAVGQASNRPPLFDGSNYIHWKEKMTLYLQATNYALWLIITKGPKIPTKVVDHISVPKLEDEFDERDYKLLQANAKAKLILVCGLDANEYNRISGCITAKEIWDKLEITYEGTSQIKESRIDMLIHDYELFTMESFESISEMFYKFTNIINALKSLGKSYTNGELVRKILRSLPNEWEAKVTAIQEAKDLTKLGIEELLGSLMAHELSMMDGSKKEAIWGENDGVANLCLMALGEEESTQDEVISNYVELESAFNELHDIFRNVCVKNSKLKKLVTSLSNDVGVLKMENATLKNDFTSIANEKNILKNNVEDLNKTLENFVKGKENLNKLLGNKRCVFDKVGIGFDPPKPFMRLNVLETNPYGPKKVWVPRKKSRYFVGGISKNTKDFERKCTTRVFNLKSKISSYKKKNDEMKITKMNNRGNVWVKIPKR